VKTSDLAEQNLRQIYSQKKYPPTPFTWAFERRADQVQVVSAARAESLRLDSEMPPFTSRDEPALSESLVSRRAPMVLVPDLPGWPCFWRHRLYGVLGMGSPSKARVGSAGARGAIERRAQDGPVCRLRLSAIGLVIGAPGLSLRA